MGQDESDLFDQWSDQSKPTKMLRSFLLAVICIFHRIFAEFVQNSLDLSKKNQIVVRFVQNSRELSKKTPNRR